MAKQSSNEIVDYEQILHDRKSIRWAAENGRIDVLKYAKEHGYTKWMNIFTSAFLSGGGHLHVLKWARENGCPWDKWTCSFAAEGGHLDVLQWARQNGCPWDQWAMAKAAKNGHLHVLKWAFENGGIFTKYTFADDCCGKHLKMLHWALQRGLHPSYPGRTYAFNYCQFTYAKKLVKFRFCVFHSRKTVHEWVETVESICDELEYTDLSNLIKIFI